MAITPRFDSQSLGQNCSFPFSPISNGPVFITESHSDQVTAKGVGLPDLSWTMEKRMRLEAWTFWMRGPAGPAGFCPKQGGKRGIHFGGGPTYLRETRTEPCDPKVLGQTP